MVNPFCRFSSGRNCAARRGVRQREDRDPSMADVPIDFLTRTLLVALRERAAPMTDRQLAYVLAMNVALVAGSIALAERRGWVEANHGENDGEVVITAAGLEVLADE